MKRRDFSSSETIGRLGAPHESGDACVFLASDASSYVTGITLPVDGGILAGPALAFQERNRGPVD